MTVLLNRFFIFSLNHTFMTIFIAFWVMSQRGESNPRSSKRLGFHLPVL